MGTMHNKFLFFVLSILVFQNYMLLAPPVKKISKFRSRREGFVYKIVALARASNIYATKQDVSESQRFMQQECCQMFVEANYRIFMRQQQQEECDKKLKTCIEFFISQKEKFHELWEKSIRLEERIVMYEERALRLEKKIIDQEEFFKAKQDFFDKIVVIEKRLTALENEVI